MKITKDSNIAIDLRKCSIKEKIMVSRFIYETLNRGKGIYRDSDMWPERATFIMPSLEWMDDDGSWYKREYNTQLISFKKFLRSVNPYKGIDVYIDGGDKKALKRAKKMGYNVTNPHVLSNMVCFRLNSMGSVTLHNHDCELGSSHDIRIRIYKDQFMNMELPEAKPEPLKFQGYEVEVGAQSIKVGCQKILRMDLEGFLQVCEIADNHNDLRLTLVDIRDFIRDNKERLGLT